MGKEEWGLAALGTDVCDALRKANNALESIKVSYDTD